MTLKLDTNIVVLSGAGISAESGIKTFRDSDGLWENHSIYDVATPEAFQRNPNLVMDFYNQRRKQLQTCEPNDGHKALVKLEEKFKVNIITQNVDDLHERAGSQSVLHLHGELNKVRSLKDESKIYTWKDDLTLEDRSPEGHPLRPHIVWFGENVPMYEIAESIVRKADILIVVGTSLQVYPAAGLIHHTDFTVPKYVIDPKRPQVESNSYVEFIEMTAAKGLPILVDRLMKNLNE